MSVPGSGDRHDEELEARLRAALRASADEVTPAGDGLARIRTRTARSHGRGWMPWAVAAAAAAVVAGAGLGFVLGDRGPQRSSVAQPATPLPSTHQTPTTVTSPTPQESPASATSAVPVYWVGQQGSRLALFREFLSAPVAGTDVGARTSAAVERALAGGAGDPDYTSPWPAGTKATTTVSSSSIGVELTLPATYAVVPPATARLAVQQLVWTATAAAQENVPVRISLADGSDTLFGLSLAKPFTRGTGTDDPRALVWILAPTQGQTVAAGALTARGEGVNAFENTVEWTLTRDGATVGHGSVMTSATDTGQRGTWSVPLDLSAPGSYVLTVAEPDPSGGESTIRWADSKAFTVR